MNMENEAMTGPNGKRHTSISTYTSNQDNPEEYRRRIAEALSITLSEDVMDLTTYIKRGKFIDSGGFGEVFQGAWTGTQDLRSMPPVAVKVVRVVAGINFIGKQRRVKQLRRELRVWHALQYKNILPLIATVCLDGDLNLPSIVSPWMENGNVMQFIKNNPATDREKLILNVIEGLDCLHSSNPQIIHGDLKAANLLVDYQGNIYVADFGLSIMLEDTSLWNTSATHPTGTVRWMAPELLKHEVKRVTSKSDIYALAMTCFEILSGQLPFAELRYDGAVMMAVAVRNERPSRFRVPKASDTVWELMTQCWKAEPDLRPDIKAAARVMKRPHFLKSIEIGLGSGAAYLMWLTCSPVDSKFIMIKDFDLFIGDYLTGEIERLDFSTNSSNKTICAQYSPDGSQVAISQNGQGGIQLLMAPDWKSSCGVLADSAGLFLQSLAFSPDGGWVVCADDKVRIWNTFSGRIVHVFQLPEVASRISIAQCGCKMATMAESGSGILLWKVQPQVVAHANMLVMLLHNFQPPPSVGKSGQPSLITDFAFSPTTDLMAVGYGDGGVDVWNIADFDVVRSFNPCGISVCAVAFSPDGSMIGCASSKSVYVMSTDEEEPIPTQLVGHAGWVSGVTFSPDGRNIISSSIYDNTIRVWGQSYSPSSVPPPT